MSTIRWRGTRPSFPRMVFAPSRARKRKCLQGCPECPPGVLEAVAEAERWGVLLVRGIGEATLREEVVQAVRSNCILRQLPIRLLRALHIPLAGCDVKLGGIATPGWFLRCATFVAHGLCRPTLLVRDLVAKLLVNKALASMQYTSTNDGSS